jgi:hypothetical protein
MIYHPVYSFDIDELTSRSGGEEADTMERDGWLS